MINNNLILIFFNIIINLIDVLTVLLPVLLSVAFMTIIERKQLGYMQRRVGPNSVRNSRNASTIRFSFKQKRVNLI